MIDPKGSLTHVELNAMGNARRAVRKNLKSEGIFKKIPFWQRPEKPSEKKARQMAEAIRSARKRARKRAQLEGLIDERNVLEEGSVGKAVHETTTSEEKIGTNLGEFREMSMLPDELLVDALLDEVGLEVGVSRLTAFFSALK